MSLTPEQVVTLLQPVQKDRIAQVNGQSHLEAWDIRRHLIRVFGFTGWDFTVVKEDLVHESTKPYRDKQGVVVDGKFSHTVVYKVIGRLTIKDPEGSPVAVFEDGATGDAVNQPAIGDAHDLALKSAMSQALKRCAVNLGDLFGLSLYSNGRSEPVVIRTLVGMPVAVVEEEKADA